jgi:DNA-binding MarR family transcriptional regulator
MPDRTTEPPPDLTTSLEAIAWTIPRLYFRLSAISEGICREFGLTPGKRAILHDLHQQGPLTISYMAKSRPVARQYIQQLVKELASSGFVTLGANPADKRSKLVELTDSGRGVVDLLAERHAALIPALAGGLNKKDVDITGLVLERLNERLAEALPSALSPGSDPS